jgi:LuxR family maltose regulon positive regulatory protein
LARLARLLEATEAAKAMGRTIETLVLQAVAFQAQGEGEQSLNTLERALSLAEPEGYVRTFIEEGALMAALLRIALARGLAPAYVTRLLAAFGTEEQEDAVTEERPPPTLAPSVSPLLEPLSERELEVLRLLKTSLSSTGIAQELFISVSTVRSHIKNIYGKLDVHSRYEAVARAEQLNLL